ncbi:MAG: sigma-70 family RNA polymerase sigma factor [Caulobacter sp.]
MPASTDVLREFDAHRKNLVEYAAAITRDRSTAEDLVQEAWLRLHDAESFLNAERPDAFLYRTVRNLALDHARRRTFERKHFTHEPAAMAGASADEADPETAAASREALRKTLQVLEALPERMAIAVRLHRLEGARLKDIAQRLGVSVTVAHGLVAEGVDRCRRALSGGR